MVGLLSLGLWLIDKGYLLTNHSKTAEDKIDQVFLIAELNNQNDEVVTFYKRGDTFYWHPGSGAYHEIYTFEIVNSEKDFLKDGYLVIPGKSKTKVVVELLPTNFARKYLEKGHMDISLYFRGDNINQFSPNVPFSKSNIEGYYIPIEIKEMKS